MVLKVVLLLAVCVKFVFLRKQFTLGGIFYADSNDLVNSLTVSANAFDFRVSIKELKDRGNLLDVRQMICDLASEGVIGVIDGTGGKTSEHIQAICDTLDLPHIVVQHNDLYGKNWTMLNLYPSPSAYNMMLTKLVEHKEWKNFTILYVKGNSFIRASDLLQLGNADDRSTVSVRELSGHDYRDVLFNAKENGYVNFVVDCPSKHLKRILLHAQQVGLMADEHSYIFLSPDLFTLDLSRYRYGGVNMTGFRLIDVEDNNELKEFTNEYNNGNANLPIQPDKIKTKVLLIRDAVHVINETLKKVNLSYSIQAESLSCDNYETWKYGSTLLNFMKTNKVVGLTRTLLFDGLGRRSQVNFDILELTPSGDQHIGEWKNDQLEISRPIVYVPNMGEESIMRNKTFKVLIALAPPYGYAVESSKKLEGNARYEGFAIDLIHRLSEILGYDYEFEVESDYGTFSGGKWTGMSLKLQEDKADFAICDLTITAERQTGIDFSMPFMSLGIGILFKKPSKQPPEMFSFMAVFSKEVWYYMLFVQLALGVIMIFVGRISNKEWQNPIPCVEQPEELKNQFSFANSVWLIIGSVMQQGSEIAPIALAPRLITSVWWFFTMVMVASYVGTLVAFLTVEKDVQPFETPEDLYNQKSIGYGAKKVGSTVQFFKNSSNPLHKAMFDKMKSNNWLLSSNDEGVAKAESSPFAFFMESMSIEYYKERHCDLIQVGELLDSKSYGIGMKKGSPYKKTIDEALLSLKERGEIEKLKNIWWKEKRGGGQCGQKRDAEEKQLSMKNMLGAFVVLGVGCGIGVVISIIDMFWWVFKRSVKYKTTFKEELIEELKFALSFSGEIKPVKRPQTDSVEALSDAEEKEVRSLRSAKSTSTHRTSHSHSTRHSRHSPLSIAFARRREYL